MSQRLRSAAAAAVLACAFLAAAAPCSSTIVAPLDLRDLVTAASAVVYGRVVDLRVAEADQRVTTVVTLGMTAFLKGDGGRTLDFRVPGGQVGRYRTVVVGAPVVAVGDELVVFLTDTPDGPATVVGFSQGLLRVVRAHEGASPTLLSPPFSRDGAGGRLVRGAAPASRVVSLAAFVDDVRMLTASTSDVARAGVPARVSREVR